jgi:hypothetical protein
MVEYFGTKFDVADASLVILDRAGRKTWGLEVKCRPTSVKARAPKFTLVGFPLPPGGVEQIFGSRITLQDGESDVDDAPQALIYVWDWTAANKNTIAVEPDDEGRVQLSWHGECGDPDAYDDRAQAGTFKIDCTCDLRYET